MTVLNPSETSPHNPYDPGPVITMADMERQPILIGSASGKIYYRPTPRAQKMHNSRARHVGYMGARYSGKTYALLHEAILCCLEVPGCSVMVIMQTFPRLRDTYLTELSKLDPAIYGGNPSAYHSTEHTLRFPNGSRIDFRTCDNANRVDKFQGQQYILIIFDEANSMPWGWELFDNLTACLRSPNRTAINKRIRHARIIVGSNPGKNQLWLKSLFISKKPFKGMEHTSFDPADYEFVFAHMNDNPYATDEAYKKALASKGLVLRRQWLDGSFDETSGTFFDNFDGSLGGRTVVSADEVQSILESQQHCIKIACMDWGRVHLCAWLFAAMVKLDGNDHILVYREYGKSGYEPTAIAEQIMSVIPPGHKFTKIYADPSIFGDMTDPHTRAKLISDRLVANGQVRLTRAKNSRAEAAGLLYDLFGGEEGKRSKLLISEECVDLLESIPELVSDPKNAEDVKKMPGKDYDDWYDCLKMLCLSHLAPREKPYEVAKQEAMQPYIDRRDFTGLLIADKRYDETHVNPAAGYKRPKSRRYFRH